VTKRAKPVEAAHVSGSISCINNFRNALAGHHLINMLWISGLFLQYDGWTMLTAGYFLNHAVQTPESAEASLAF
ncbi:MAG: hypothetical protein QGI70_17060, partial [Paracoccaceae bacterium]|nr:hypothetical protein [Paracoccaceae bacterium]